MPACFGIIRTCVKQSRRKRRLEIIKYGSSVIIVENAYIYLKPSNEVRFDVFVMAFLKLFGLFLTKIEIETFRGCITNAACILT